MTADAAVMHYFVLLFMFKMIPVPAGHSQGAILGVPPPPRNFKFATIFILFTVGQEVSSVETIWADIHKKPQLQLVHSASSQMDNTVNICHFLHEVTVFTPVKSCYIT